MSNDPIIGVFHDCATGETIERELTQEEIDAIPNDLPSTIGE